MDENIYLVPIEPADDGFLYTIYASTRLDELAAVDWSDTQVETFLRMQFKAQHIYYQDVYAGSDFHIIYKDNMKIGRLYVARQENEIIIIDISLLPEYKRQGVGSYFLKQLIAEAKLAGKQISLHVEKMNPILVLYEKLGFQKVEDTGVYFKMIWQEGNLKSLPDTSHGTD